MLEVEVVSWWLLEIHLRGALDLLFLVVTDDAFLDLLAADEVWVVQQVVRVQRTESVVYKVCLLFNETLEVGHRISTVLQIEFPHLLCERHLDELQPVLESTDLIF